MRNVEHDLSGIDLLTGLDNTSLEKLESRCRWQRYNEHEQIIDEKSDSCDLYFVIEGRVRVVNYSLSGREITLNEIERGGYFGEFAALDGQPRSASVVALSETLVGAITQGEFLELLRSNADLGVKVMQELVRLIRTSTDRIMALSTLGAHNRVHSEILREAKLAISVDNRAVIAPIPLHADIASRASTTRETVARVFGDLAKQGLVKRGKKELIVENIDRLESLVEHLREMS